MSNSIMQLNYDDLRLMCKTFHNEGEDFVQLNTSTRQRLSDLQREWQGDAALAFFREMNEILLPALQRTSSALFSAETVLNQIINIIYEADLEVSQYFKGLDGGSIFSSGNLLSAIQNLYASGQNLFGVMKDFWGKIANNYGLNLFDINFTKNVVGLLDSLKVFKKIPLLGPLLGIGLGTLQDGLEGKDWLRAFRVNSTDAALQYAIGLTGVGEAVLLANSAIQIKGTISIFTDKLLANLVGDETTRQLLIQQADLKAEALKKMDLGNITKSLSEISVDSRFAPEKLGDDFLGTIKSTVNFVDGVADMSVLDPDMINSGSGMPSFHQSATQVVVQDWLVQHLPVSDAFKQASTLYTHQFVENQTNTNSFLVNIFNWR